MQQLWFLDTGTHQMDVGNGEGHHKHQGKKLLGIVRLGTVLEDEETNLLFSALIQIF